MGKAPPPAAEADHLSTGGKLAKMIGDFWQLATAIVGIVMAIVAGFTYFATRQQLNQSECVTSYNLLLTTLPSQIEQLTLEIRLADAELKKLPKRSGEATNKQEEIDELKARKKKLNDQYEDALEKLKQQACFKSSATSAEKKP
jgi:hypothetical protein